MTLRTFLAESILELNIFKHSKVNRKMIQLFSIINKSPDNFFGGQDINVPRIQDGYQVPTYIGDQESLNNVYMCNLTSGFENLKYRVFNWSRELYLPHFREPLLRRCGSSFRWKTGTVDLWPSFPRPTLPSRPIYAQHIEKYTNYQ